MPHYKSMFEDNGMLYACHLDGKDFTLTIRKVEAGSVTGSKGKKDKKPIVHFERTDKKLALNKTNGKVIAGMYGPDTDDWVGKRITLYATTTEFGSETVECIRVRPKVPPAPADAQRRGNGRSAPAPAPAPAQDEHGDPPPPDDVPLPGREEA